MSIQFCIGPNMMISRIYTVLHHLLILVIVYQDWIYSNDLIYEPAIWIMHNFEYILIQSRAYMYYVNMYHNLSINVPPGRLLQFSYFQHN